ncbi:MAG: bile acid:sodium symporter family protein [Lautropia sp.]|nr:bile acid:sodium symporter family protein [Lautropia sp.]
MNLLLKMTRLANRTMALWVLAFAALAFVLPDAFQWVRPWIPYLLGAVMLGMGLTLKVSDFREVLRYPKAVFIGVTTQFLLMPALAFALSRAFALPPELATGVVLVGACPGGTASNVITYLARGNTALSVACTTVATLLAPFLTPLVFWLFASQWLQVDASGMFISVLQIVLLPIAAGVVLKTLLGHRLDRVAESMPLVSVLAIVLIVGAVVAGSKARIIDSGLLIFAVVVVHNGLGYLGGWLVARACRLPFNDAKAVSIEVGMQNSGLGAALAGLHFAAQPVVAVPSAIFSFWHNVSGPMLANWFASRTPEAGATSHDRSGPQA